MEEGYLVEVKDITKIFPGTKALNRISLKIKKGEIHAICGENGAGKSTLMNIIGGIFPPTEGTMVFDEREIIPKNPWEAQNIGIGFVHQELSLCPHLTAAENIFIGRLPRKGDMIDFKRLWNEADSILARFSANFSSKMLVNNLTVSEQQLVEIGKSISLNCKLLILDEPTSSLTDKETIKLFDIVKNLSENGISILYISHRMSEIFELCERVTVLKDGSCVSTMVVKDVTMDDVIRAMVGRELGQLYPEKSSHIETDKEILKVENLSGALFRNINFSLYRGEILGFAGLVGAGRSEIMQGLCGLDRIHGGSVTVNGEKKVFNSYRDAIKNGICYLTEDRKRFGIFPGMNIMDNMVSANLKAVSRNIWFDTNLGKALINKYVGRLNIKVADINNLIISLSGGNQQKCLVGKWLSVSPKVIIMDEPTRGIDVGSKAEIHILIRNLSKQGMGVIIVSSELPEIIGICDRIAIIYEGDLMGFLSGDMVTEENVMMLASGKKLDQGVGG